MTFLARSFFCVLPVALLVPQAWGQQQLVDTDAIAQNFFLPELIMRTYEMIGLTEQQKTELKADYDDAKEQLTQFKESIKKESDALLEMVKKEKIDEKQVMDQAEKVLNLESDAKRAQLRLLIRIKNKLTPEQQVTLTNLKGKMAGLQAKMREAQELAKGWQAEGRDLSALEAKKEQFDQLVKEGKIEEAEKMLDEAILTLKQKGEK